MWLELTEAKSGGRMLLRGEEIKRFVEVTDYASCQQQGLPKGTACVIFLNTGEALGVKNSYEKVREALTDRSRWEKEFDPRQLPGATPS